MRTLIKNARVVSPDRDLPNASILVENGRIANVRESGK